MGGRGREARGKRRGKVRRGGREEGKERGKGKVGRGDRKWETRHLSLSNLSTVRHAPVLTPLPLQIGMYLSTSRHHVDPEGAGRTRGVFQTRSDLCLVGVLGVLLTEYVHYTDTTMTVVSW